jgi:leader peptidase (prepilin peptidase) / N-methyltransferase
MRVSSLQMLERWRNAVSSMLEAQRSTNTIAILFSGVYAVVASIVLIPGLDGSVGAGLAGLMFAIAAVDARCFVIPDELTVMAIALGLADAAIKGGDPSLQACIWAALRGVASALVFLTLRIIYRRIRGYHGMGLGDVKLAGVAGVWLAASVIPFAIEIAAVAALGSYMVRHMRSHETVQRSMRLPFGLFLAPAIWISWLLDMMIFPPAL